MFIDSVSISPPRHPVLNTGFAAAPMKPLRKTRRMRSSDCLTDNDLEFEVEMVMDREAARAVGGEVSSSGDNYAAPQDATADLGREVSSNSDATEMPNAIANALENSETLDKFANIMEEHNQNIGLNPYSEKLKGDLSELILQTKLLATYHSAAAKKGTYEGSETPASLSEILAKWNEMKSFLLNIKDFKT